MYGMMSTLLKYSSFIVHCSYTTEKTTIETIHAWGCCWCYCIGSSTITMHQIIDVSLHPYQKAPNFGVRHLKDFRVGPAGRLTRFTCILPGIYMYWVVWNCYKCLQCSFELGKLRLTTTSLLPVNVSCCCDSCFFGNPTISIICHFFWHGFGESIDH